MSQENFNNLTSEEKRRLGVVPERFDLFETKLLQLGSRDPSLPCVLTVMRDPGNTAGLLPVVRGLISKGNGVSVLADGRGLERIAKEGFEVKDLLGDTRSSLEVSSQDVDVILASNTTSEQGLEQTLIYSNDAPVVAMEDMYGSIDRMIKSASESNDAEEEKKRKEFVLGRLAKVCVMDEGSKRELIGKYPSLEGRVVVTGQPLFDRIYGEDSEAMRSKVRLALGINDDEKFVVFFGASSTDSLPGTPNSKIALERIVESLKKSRDKIKFVFTNHPRDLVTESEYQEILSQLGDKALSIKEAKKFDSDHLERGADVVVSIPLSTTIYDAIYRRKPTIVLTENRGEMRVPAIDTGSALEVSDPNLFRENLSTLVGEDEGEVETMRRNQEDHYPLDGKNTERVIDVIEEVIKSNER